MYYGAWGNGLPPEKAFSGGDYTEYYRYFRYHPKDKTLNELSDSNKKEKIKLINLITKEKEAFQRKQLLESRGSCFISFLPFLNYFTDVYYYDRLIYMVNIIGTKTSYGHSLIRHELIDLYRDFKEGKPKLLYLLGLAFRLNKEITPYEYHSFLDTMAYERFLSPNFLNFMLNINFRLFVKPILNIHLPDAVSNQILQYSDVVVDEENKSKVARSR